MLRASKIANLFGWFHRFRAKFEYPYVLQSVYPEPSWVKPEQVEGIPPCLRTCNYENSLMVNGEPSCSTAEFSSCAGVEVTESALHPRKFTKLEHMALYLHFGLIGGLGTLSHM